MNSLSWTSLRTTVVANRTRCLAQLARKTFDAKNLCSSKSLPLQPWYPVDPFVSVQKTRKHTCFHPESVLIWTSTCSAELRLEQVNSLFSQIHPSRKLCVTPNTYLLRKPHCIPSKNSSHVVSYSLNIYPIVDSHNHT